MRLRKAAIVPALVAVSALTLTACGGGSGKAAAPKANASASTQSVTLGTAADAQGPAKPTPGAKSGGTITDLEPTGLDYLDPSQIYENQLQAISALYSRQLTTYKTDPTTGKTILVGDMATDTGTSSDGGKTWTFTLKDGLKFEDGTPIASKDVKYAVERLYAPYQTSGPLYLQQWLSGANYRTVYPGPYGGQSLPDSVIATPDAKTIVFHFQQAHSDAPYAMAEQDATAIEASKDDQQSYNNHPVSIGPYKIQSYQNDKELVLVKNPEWDPSTDAVRHQYADKWDIQLSVPQPLLTQRLINGSGPDNTAVSFSSNADSTLIDQIQGNPQLKARTVNQFEPFVDVYSINTTRVTDVNVRKALAAAFPAAQVIRQLGGAATTEISGNLMSPTMSGWQKTDPLGIAANPTGDIAKAKQILTAAGKLGYPITIAYANTTKWQNITAVVVDQLNQAGFKAQSKDLDATSYYTIIGKADNQFDLYRTGWGADWPIGSTVIPPTLDGRLVADGSNNYSHLNDPAMDTQMDQIGAVTDINQAAPQWMSLADKILATDVPQIPYAYDKLFTLYGAGLGGVTYNPGTGALDPSSMFAK
ncbi:peptide/nickel transport system substrate-binding protein [Kitasatospora sp. MAA4]|uniref:ABC transporter substrate-binding protein n=1 Tax=Kitasatospora sp. MAA4 TaxID=3035093 RepID=UPI002475C04C|nr:ABC transporter substrate-binding protein [Kitasatospora sp. MAA4]MDH6135056.1 peptide/nickel transport system substrate-binding protein [Kitasatospora sp. MAA4]